jgi:hypothetical protein
MLSIDHAHSILGAISLIQMVQPGARKAVPIEAVLGFGVHHLLTVLDSAHNANFLFEAVVASATGHGFFSLVCAMQRGQFIPKEPISFEEIAVVFFDFI